MAENKRTVEPHPIAWPTNPTGLAAITFLQERFGDAILEVVEHRGETTITVAPERVADIGRALRDEPSLRFTFMADLTAVDWLDREPRFDIVYHLLALDTRGVLRLKARVGDEETPEPELPTVTGVWPSANFYEREVFDLFGVRFVGHPNLTRIMLPHDWVGHPLRKDYPQTGIRLPEPHWGGQIPFDQPLPPGTGNQTLRTPEGREQTPPTTEPGVRRDER
ncbi:MAG TPA: NADH-quinone oxidoreductase subunit C [Ktedonobacterales bacterium]